MMHSRSSRSAVSRLDVIGEQGNVVGRSFVALAVGVGVGRESSSEAVVLLVVVVLVYMRVLLAAG